MSVLGKPTLDRSSECDVQNLVLFASLLRRMEVLSVGEEDGDGAQFGRWYDAAHMLGRKNANRQQLDAACERGQGSLGMCWKLQQIDEC